MAKTYMGFEGIIYAGAEGSTASNQLLNCVDITYGMTTEEGDTTPRGDGSSVPLNTSEVTAVISEINFTMLNVASDTELEAIRAAAATGGRRAIRTKDHAAGKGFDGDCHFTVSNGKPLRGQQTVEIVAKPSRHNRVPQPYV